MFANQRTSQNEVSSIRDLSTPFIQILLGWQSIKSQLFQALQVVRDRRLTHERKQLLRRRFDLFRTWLREHSEFGQENCPLLFMDYAIMPEIRAILDTPSDIDVTLDSFSPLTSLLPDLTQRWYEEIKATLSESLKSSLNLSNCDAPLSLAVATFDGYAERRYLRIPEVLTLPELRPAGGTQDLFIQTLAWSVVAKATQYPLRVDRLYILKPALDIIRLVKLFGGDPSSTTYDEIVQSRVRVRCTHDRCQKYDAASQHMSWETAVS